MSDPEADVENDRKKGTPDHDALFCTRPLLDNIRSACKAYYHPRKELSIDVRMAGTKAKTSMARYAKNKPTKWGFKLFVLANSSNGYTEDFLVYTGKAKAASANRLPYDSVMTLINPAFLGTRYDVYMDNFYTSPKLFKDLKASNFGTCGT
ncbi:hypothetical protein LDENG_00185290 [Lucifuga dentata]|nr:hypothetical protein LDENG_00185290 [Lucifuga dentata]